MQRPTDQQLQIHSKVDAALDKLVKSDIDQLCRIWDDLKSAVMTLEDAPGLYHAVIAKKDWLKGKCLAGTVEVYWEARAKCLAGLKSGNYSGSEFKPAGKKYEARKTK